MNTDTLIGMTRELSAVVFDASIRKGAKRRKIKHMSRNILIFCSGHAQATAHWKFVRNQMRIANKI